MDHSPAAPAAHVAETSASAVPLSESELAEYQKLDGLYKETGGELSSEDFARFTALRTRLLYSQRQG